MEGINTPLVIKAPAKVNLLLKIRSKRPDGYHELFTLMVPVMLFDTLRVVRKGRGIRLVCKGEDVPSNHDNLVWRACEAFFSETGLEPCVEIILEKKIPVAAGLGGGSSDAAFTLKALNRIHDEPLEQKRLHAIARGLGADVPFFLDCRPSLATGIGDVLEPFLDLPRFWYVIVVPPFRVSTAWAYGQVKLELTQPAENYIVKFREALYARPGRFLENDLETVVVEHFPAIGQIKKELLKAGADGVVMSGSGPSVVGLFRDRGKAEEALSLASEGAGVRAFLTMAWEENGAIFERGPDKRRQT